MPFNILYNYYLGILYAGNKIVVHKIFLNIIIP